MNDEPGPQGISIPKNPGRRLLAVLIVAAVVVALLLVLLLFGTWGLPYHWACERGSELAYGDFWTPVVLLNAPFHGAANATGVLMSDGEPIAGAAGSIGAVNGGSEGLFAIGTWLIYSTSTYLALGPGPSVPCTGSLIAVLAPIIGPDPKTGREVTPVQLAGPGSAVTQGVQTSFTLDEYQSVEWNMDYNTSLPPLANQTSCGPTSFLPFYNQLNVTVPYQGHNLLAVIYSVQVFVYSFPPPANYLIQDSPSGTWAFDYHSVLCPSLTGTVH